MKSKANKFGRVVLACALAAAQSAALVLPAMAQEPAQVSTAAVEVPDEDSLRALVTPVLQSYVPDENGGVWQIDAGSRLVIAASDANLVNERLGEVVRLINAEMQDKGLIETPVPMVYSPKEAANRADIVVDLSESVTDESSSPEAYRIEIGENGVHITGASENAVLNALHTMEQLIARGEVPFGTIVDYPDVAERRIHVDCARKYISKDWFIRQIHEMSYLKMNALQMHFSENLGFRIECETDPAIVSEEHLTKAEVREILAEAKKYGVSVIPSFDSPGHVDQILKAHPEYGQVSSTGSHYASGLDITNQEAIDYIKSLYAEYMDLFEGCTDIHIGGDEYMEFDRAPFTTQYQSVLNAYAKEKYGEEYTWKDAVAGYINDLAEFCHDRGFRPRIFNDGIYYGESSYSSASNQKIVMHDYIGIDFWSQMSWNYSIAKLNTFVNHGHDTIYNLNASYFYYVLRSSKPTDGREQHSFDNLNPDKLIYNNWTPGQFQANTVDDASDFIKGAAIAVWCDIPDLVEEDVIHEDIENPTRALASKAWNVDSPSVKSWEDFEADFETLGHAGAYEKGAKLDDSGEILPAESLSRIVLHYQLADGTALKADSVRYGSIGDAFDYAADAIYGYRLKEGSAQGVFDDTVQEFTFVYEKYTDKSVLQNLVDSAIAEDTCIPLTYTEYKTALQQAQTVLADADAWQKDADEAVKALEAAAAKCVKLADFVLYAEVLHPLPAGSYISGYPAYSKAVADGKTALYDPASTPEDLDAALQAIKTAAAGLMKPDGNTPTVTATHNWYEPSSWNPTGQYNYDKMFDGNVSTKCWFGQNQTAGAVITMEFPRTLNMTAVEVNQPDNDDYLRSAEVQISLDGETWTTVGTISGKNDLVKTCTFEKTPVRYVRLELKESTSYWYQINEISFTYDQVEEDTTLSDLLTEAGAMDLAGKDFEKAAEFVDAYLAVRELYASGLEDTEGKADALRAAMAALNGSVVKKADKTLLEMAIDYAEARKAENALEHLNGLVVTRFENALAAAKAVYADEGASQKEIDEAWMELSYAIHMLGFTADKSSLEQLVAEADALNPDAYADGEAKDAFLAALEAARAVLDSQTALDESIQSAYDALAAAMEGLQAKDIDTRMLAWLVSEVKDADLDAYCNPESEKKAFSDALSHALEVLAAPVSQEAVDEAALSLSDAWLQLRLKPSEDMLKALQSFTEELAAINRSEYKAEALHTLDALGRKAKALLADPHASRDEVQAVLDEIEAARPLFESGKLDVKAPAADSLAPSGNASVSAPAAKAPAANSASVKTAASSGLFASSAAAIASLGLFGWLKRRNRKK